MTQERIHRAEDVVETCNGYPIRKESTRFGTLFAVLGTDPQAAYQNIEAARAHALSMPSKVSLVIVRGNVHQYFEEKLGHSPLDDSLTDLPVESECGQDCVKVIDAAAAYLAVVRDTAGELQGIVIPVLDSVNEAVETLWRG
jgi:hypothetical protein